MEPLFQTTGLAFGGFLHYGDLSFPNGKVTFITGESGSGKSTLLKILNGTVSPSAGRAFYHGRDIGALDSVPHRREVSLVSQEPYLFEGSIRDNFNAYYGYRNQSLPSDSEIKKMLALFRLDFSADAQTGTFSGGEKQRLYLAIFLSFRPNVLLLDEPTSALDGDTGAFVLSGIKKFCLENNSNLLAVSHNAEITARFSDHTITLKKAAAL